MALVVTEVTYSKNPVSTGEAFLVSVAAVETMDDEIMYSGTFYSGQEIKL